MYDQEKASQLKENFILLPTAIGNLWEQCMALVQPPVATAEQELVIQIPFRETYEDEPNSKVVWKSAMYLLQQQKQKIEYAFLVISVDFLSTT